MKDDKSFDRNQLERSIERMFKVVVCCQCGQLLLTKAEQKSKLCPYCNVKLSVRKARVMAHAETAQEASELIRVLKRKKTVC